MIPEQAVVAATESVIASLRALELGWVDTDMPDGVTIDVRDFDLTAAISAALKAAAPYMQSSGISATEIEAVAHMLKAAKAEGWDEGQKSGMRHADRLVAAAKIGRPDLPGPISPNPYQKAEDEKFAGWERCPKRHASQAQHLLDCGTNE